MRAELITDSHALEKLRDPWQLLWESCEYATPFQTPAWNLAWWSCMGHGELFTVAVWDEARLAGLAPLFLYHDPDTALRRLLLLGTSITDQMDVLLAPGQEQTALDAIWTLLQQRKVEWDVLDLQDLPSSSPLVSALKLPSLAAVSEHDLCRAAPLPEAVAEWLEQLPHGLKRNLRRYREKLQQKHQIEFALCRPETRQRFFDAFLRLHQEQWEASGETGMLAETRVQKFHCTVLDTLPADIPRFAGLLIDGEFEAVVYFLACRGKAYAYLSGYSPRFAAYSPGSLILGYVFEQAIRAGLREWDFLRGREGYKTIWGVNDRPTWRITASSPL